MFEDPSPATKWTSIQRQNAEVCIEHEVQTATLNDFIPNI